MVSKSLQLKLNTEGFLVSMLQQTGSQVPMHLDSTPYYLLSDLVNIQYI